MQKRHMLASGQKYTPTFWGPEEHMRALHNEPRILDTASIGKQFIAALTHGRMVEDPTEARWEGSMHGGVNHCLHPASTGIYSWLLRARRQRDLEWWDNR